MIDIIETVYRGASKGRGLVVSPKGMSEHSFTVAILLILRPFRLLDALPILINDFQPSAREYPTQYSSSIFVHLSFAIANSFFTRKFNCVREDVDFMTSFSIGESKLAT
jgi:hypothetical protein